MLRSMQFASINLRLALALDGRPVQPWSFALLTTAWLAENLTIAREGPHCATQSLNQLLIGITLSTQRETAVAVGAASAGPKFLRRSTRLPRGL
jgi:hypothetical protein